jgi:hypothetical protein
VQLPSVVDRFTPLLADDPARVDMMMAHCLPTGAQIVGKIHDVREDYIKAGPGRLLDILYLANKQSPWLDEIKVELKAAGWYTIAMTRGLQVDVEQTDGSAGSSTLERHTQNKVRQGWPCAWGAHASMK